MAEENSLVLKLKKSFQWEGKTYTEIDLSKLDTWTADNLITATKKFNAMTGADNNALAAIVPESNIEYDLFIAAEASGLPFDLFKALPAREVGPLKALIINFFLGEAS